jgi:integrase
MRPLKHGLLSYVPHLYIRRDTYYYRADIPSDIKHYFHTPEIKQSLKTKDSKVAKVLAISMEYRLQRTYAMIRSGMLPEDIIVGMVAEIYPNRKAEKPVGMLLTSLISDYVKANEDKWTHKTKSEITSCHRLIVDVMGDVDVKTITRKMVLNFKDIMIKLPSNIYKIHVGKTVQEVLMVDGIVPMSITSVNKHILRLGALLGHAVKESIIQANLAQGMMIPEKRRSDEERKAYSLEDLQSIVANLPRTQDRPDRFWVPLISMFTGMRLDEICQLYLEDVQKVDDVWCISINDEKDKKVKTVTGKRIVPVHPVLLSCGFIEYVDSLRKADVPRLWMDLRWRPSDGYSNALGKWFQVFNRRHVTDDPKKVFHSFRHTLADTLKQAGIQEVVIAEIMGHANDSMTTGRYGKRYQPKVLLEALVQLDYGVTVTKWNM